MYSRWTGYCKEILRIFLGRQNGHVQALIIAPILAVSFLGFVVRAASSAVDPALAKNGVIAQLQQRLSEIQNRTDVLKTALVQEPIQKLEPVLSREKTIPAGMENAAPSVKETLLSPSQQDVAIRKPLLTEYRIKRNETFETILKKAGLPPAQTAAWITAAQKRDESRRLQINHTVTFSYDYDHNGTSTLRAVAYSINKRSRLVLEKDESGRIEVRVKTIPTTLVWRVVGGRITRSLGSAATNIGVPASIVDAVADMDWDLNLSYEIQPDALFKIIYEENQHNGQAVDYGRVLAAEIVNKGERYTVFSLEAEDGFDGSGGQFLRYPVRFTRISSVFSDARLHPIYKRRRPHLGVDFAAPTGTSVRAVASGRVSYAGWRGNYGRFLKIDHAGPYSSAYAHLYRIKKGVRAGTRVKRGQIIGYVGSSGAATGPHLHFEMHKNGRYINPLKKVRIAREKKVLTKPPDPQLVAIKKKLQEYLAALSVQNEPKNRVYKAIPSVQTAAREAVEPRA